MNGAHQQLGEGRWEKLNFLEQMANIGSEVERSLNWRSKGNTAYCRQAFERALYLVDLTLADSRNIRRLKEIARVREALVEFFFGANHFMSTDASWRKYFMFFTYAARKNY